MPRSYVCHDSIVYVQCLHMCAMTHSQVMSLYSSGRTTVTSICVPRLMCACAMTHLYVCHDSFVCLPGLIYMCAMAHPQVILVYSWYRRVDHCARLLIPFSVPRLIYTCAMTHLYVCHGSFVCVPGLIYMFAMAHPQVIVLVLISAHDCDWRMYAYACHDSFLRMTHSYVCHYAYVCVPWLIHRWCRCIHLDAQRE